MHYIKNLQFLIIIIIVTDSVYTYSMVEKSFNHTLIDLD